MEIKNIEKSNSMKIRKALLVATMISLGGVMFSLGSLSKLADRKNSKQDRGYDIEEYIPEYEIVTIDGVQYKKITRSVNPIVKTNADGTKEYLAPANATEIKGSGENLICYTTILEPLTSEEEVILTRGH